MLAREIDTTILLGQNPHDKHAVRMKVRTFENKTPPNGTLSGWHIA